MMLQLYGIFPDGKITFERHEQQQQQIQSKCIGDAKKWFCVIQFIESINLINCTWFTEQR